MSLGQFFGISTAGNNGVECRVYVSITDDAANNRSTIDAELQFRKTNGFTSQGNTGGSFTIHGNGGGLTVTGNKTLPGSGAPWVSFGASGRQTINHGADGKAPRTEVRVNGVYMSGSSDFDTAVSGTLAFDSTNGFADYNRLPSAPGAPVVTPGSLTPTAMAWTWTAPTTVGGGILEYEFRYSKSSTYASGVTTVSTGTTRSYAMTLLDPGNVYNVSARARTGDGWGPWSENGSQTTLPATPPGFTVASSPSGSQATLTFSPPGGVTGVTKYTWERRATGTTSPVATGDSATISAVITDLVPGNSYDWRASAWIGTYQSPWTDWTTLVQTKPNTNPGDYFDGATPDVADLDYSWTGAANLSTSIATAKGVAGWEVEMAGGAAVLYRVTAGIFAAYAARVQITADASGAGCRFGQVDAEPFWSEVTPAATYIGSIHVRPSRSQSLAAEITWLTSGGAVVGARTVGAASVVPGGTWARLVGGGIAPAGAQRGVVRVIDVAGTGWSKWLGGETIDLDGAMISLNEEFPYFDGDTIDETGTYVYDWEGDPNTSQSTRTPVALVEGASRSSGPEISGRALVDPDCNTVPPPPRPPTVPSDCIDDIGVWRRYYAEIPANQVPDWMDVVPTLEITSGPFAARQVRVRYYPNPEDLPIPEVDTTGWIAEQIISYMPASTVMTLDGVTQRVWAEVAGNVPQSGDHLLYGTNGKPAVWPILGCGIGYLVSVEVPISEPEGNVVVSQASLTART